MSEKAAAMIVLFAYVSQVSAAMLPVQRHAAVATPRDSDLGQPLPSDAPIGGYLFVSGLDAPLGAHLFASDLEEASPDITMVMIIAIGCAAVVVVFAFLCQALEYYYVTDQGERIYFDCMIDSAAAILLYLNAGLLCGLMSEYIVTHTYTTGKLSSMAFIVFVNKLITVPIGAVLMFTAGQLRCDPEPSLLTSVPGLLSGIDAVIGGKALLYITFPVASIFKSTAVIPTMIMNTVMNGEYASWQEYFVAGIISVCVAGFSLASSKDSSPQNTNMQLGISMMVVFLVLTSFISVAQKRIFNSYSNFTTLQMMMISALWASAFSFVVVQTSTGVHKPIVFCRSNPACVTHLLAMSLASTTHLYLCFYIVKHQGPVILTVLTCLEKILGVLLSAKLYGHHLTTLAEFCALGACLGALGITFLELGRKRRESAFKHTGHLRDLFRAAFCKVRSDQQRLYVCSSNGVGGPKRRQGDKPSPTPGET
jgi:adenosine 3'-phospho 5'-phosphosulfate transporter B2